MEGVSKKSTLVHPGRGGALCVEICFIQTFPRNQDVTVKLKSELIFIKFQYFFNVLADPKSICFTQTIPSMFEP